MVAALRGELNPDAWPVDAHVVAPIAQVRVAGVGNLDLIEFGLIEPAVFCPLRAITRPGRDRILDEILRGIGKLGDRNSLALGGELAVLAGTDVDIVETRFEFRLFRLLGCEGVKLAVE